jgi:hypothetical protein
MGWIKRNLYFVIGSVAALAVMGLAGWYLYSKWSLNNEIVTKLDEQYAELDRLNKLNPHPGEPGKIDNIEEAKNQQKQLRAVVRNTQPHFQRIAPIPDVPKLSDPDFSRALSRTIDQMQKDAANVSVTLPPKSATGSAYSFSFEAQKSKVSFAAGSLTALAVQLGEVKAISEILFQAKINSLDSLRRESVSADDAASPQAQTDYTARRSVTNELAVLSPYDITFRCFSSELAAVLAGFGSSPYGLIVKTLVVEPTTTTAEEGAQPVVMQPTVVAPIQPVPQPNPYASAAADRAAMERRYGPMRGSGGEGGPGRGYPQPGGYPNPYTPPATPAPVAPTTTSRSGLSTVLDEKQLKVTITLDVVKLTPAK